MTKNIKKLIDRGSTWKLLSFFCDNPSKRFYSRQAASGTGLSYGTAYSGLRELFVAGALKREKVGREEFYWIDLDNTEVRTFRTFLAVSALKPLIEAIKGNCSKIVLYGSGARGTYSELSDFDLLVVTTNKSEVQKKIAGYTGKKVSTVFKTPSELVSLKRNDPALYENAVIGGILLHERA